MTILFLTYINRSGSTYLANLISSSKEICVCLEGDKLVSLFLEDPGKPFQLTQTRRDLISDVFERDPKLALWKTEDSMFLNISRAKTNLEAFISILDFYKNMQKPEAGFILFKAERIAALMEKIFMEKSFIQDKILFLNLIRDPRAIVASQLKTNLPGSTTPMSSNPLKTALKWAAYARRLIDFSCDNDVQLIETYESFISNMGDSLSKISGFTGLDLSSCLPENGDLKVRLSEDENHIHPRIGNSPDDKRIDDWKIILNKGDIYHIERTGRDYMERFGYEFTGPILKPFLEIYRVIKILLIHISTLSRKLKFHLKRQKFET